eukprot:GHVP01000731.1.p1 GENE.GHVP01000731.1~~GHVP01000731.1.p1  ORF type:complete len:2861 (-),score=520.34 GHVP01000731.1:173-8755(-)
MRIQAAAFIFGVLSAPEEPTTTTQEPYATRENTLKGVVPTLDHLGFAHMPTEESGNVYQFDTNSFKHNVTLYSYEPVVMSARAPAEFYVDFAHPLEESRAVDQSITWTYRPTGEEGSTEELLVWVTNNDRSIVSNYTFNVKTVTSTNPRIGEMTVSPGRIDPVFRPHLYTYYARVPEGSRTATIDFTPVNSRDTKCVVGEGGPVKQGPSSITVNLAADFSSETIRINCVAKDTNYKVQYVVEIVPQLGGSTQLAELDIYGATFDRPFDPLFNGPYQVDLCFQRQKDFNWLAFHAKPVNDKAIVTVEREKVDPESHHSPYFNIRLGETRQFKVEVFTEQNHANEIYDIIVSRCASKNEKWGHAHGWGNTVAHLSSWVSAVRAHTYIWNMKFLQWISVTNRLNGLPETYDYFSDAFHPFNDQEPLTPNAMQHYTYEFGEDNYTFHYPPNQYSHIIEQVQLTEDSISSLTASFMASVSNGESLFDGDHARYETAVRSLIAAKEDKFGPMSRADKRELLKTLDNEAKVHKKISQFAESLISVSVVLGLLVAGYAAAWAMYLKNTKPTNQKMRQDFPQILHPGRFFTFLCDLFLISITQSTLGLMFLAHKDAVVKVFFFNATPWGLLVYSILVFLAIPCCFVALGCFVLYKIRSSMVWSKSLNSHHDRICYEARAFYSICSWVPILGQLLTVEVKSVAPLYRPAKEAGNPAIVFADEKGNDGPWLEADPEKALAAIQDSNGSGEGDVEKGDDQALVDGNEAALEHDPVTDRVKVEIDEPTYTNNFYDNRNADVLHRYPKAHVGYTDYGVKNAYDVPVALEIEVQLQHLSPLMAAMESYTVWVPREQLQMTNVNNWGNLFLHTQRGGFLHWAFDRIVMLALIFFTSIWQDKLGTTQTIFFLAASAALLVLNVPSAIADGTARWYNVMRKAAANKEKEEAELAEEQEAFGVWPFKEEKVKEKFEEMQQQKEDKRWFGAYGFFRASVFDPYKTLMAQPFWHTRAYEVTKSVLNGPVFYEASKVMIVFHALLGNRTWGLLGNRFSSFFMLFWACVGVICLNTKAAQIFWKEFVWFVYECQVLMRRGVLWLVDAITTKGSNNYIRVRDFTVWHSKLVQNEFGMHFNAECKVPDAEKKAYNKSDMLDKRRFQIHKTLYQLGPVGASRDEVDRTFPIQMPLQQLYGKAENLDRVAATIQIVNHTSHRYGTTPEFKHTSEDDSFLTLLTDPDYVPEMGRIRVRKGHGYAVRYDQETHKLFIRGPGIIDGRTYNATTGGPDAERRGSDLSTERTAPSVPDGSIGSAEAFCTEAGILTVQVPAGQTPNVNLNVTVRSPAPSPSGGTFHINPNMVKIVYDKSSRHMYLRARSIEAHKDPYTVQWSIRGDTVNVKGSGVAHEGGVLVLDLEKEGLPNLEEYITLRDDTDAVLYCDPRATDLYQVYLPEPQYTGFVRIMQNISTYWNNTMNFLLGKSAQLDTLHEPIPCTIVQCTDPVQKTFRVEPNFHDAALSLNSKLEETLAKLDSLSDPTQLGVVCFSVMTSGEFGQFFRQNDVEIETEGRWINPLLDPTHPIFRDMFKQIRDAEPLLRDEVQSRLKIRVVKLENEKKKVLNWINAYADKGLYQAQMNKDNAEWRDESEEEVEAAIKTLRQLKTPHEANIPGFVYPLNVDHKQISKKPNTEAQMVQWRHTVEQWLIQEENAHRGGASKLGNSHYQCLLSEIMRAIEMTFNRGEDLSQGTFKTVLHFITNSKVARGVDFQWRPDPVCAHQAWVRTWGCDENSVPDFDKPIWLPCSLKLSANSVKILMPNIDDSDRPIATPHQWKRVTGWYVPLPAFEMVEIRHDPQLPPNAVDAMKTTNTKMVLRKTQKLDVDDNYVRRTEDDHFDHVITFTENNELRRACVYIGHVTDNQTAERWLANEKDASPHNDGVNVHPLTFRFNDFYTAKWHSVIVASRLAGAPMEYDSDFDGKRGGEPVPSESYESTYETEIEEIEDIKGSYDGGFMSKRYHGKGVLKDKDGNVVYDGDWKDGQRWGKGKCNFKDKQGIAWTYDGEFISDQPCGKGLLVMTDEKQIETLKTSKDGKHKYTITKFEGQFKQPREIARSHSIPVSQNSPLIDWSQMKKLFDDNADQKTKDEIVIDIKRAISFGDDGNSIPLSVFGEEGAPTPDQQTALTDEYLPHHQKWAKLIDPNAGYESMLDRMGSGTMTFANGSSYQGGLKNGLPNGKGYLSCWKCNTKYDGQWKDGKPHGKGIVVSGVGNERDIYSGEWNEGKRHGEGRALTRGGAIYMEGTFKDDVIDSGDVKCQVSPMAEKIGIVYPYKEYHGEMVNGVPEGEGRIVFNDGAEYRGGFKDGLRSGQGVQTDTDGKSAVSGTWEKDFPNGRVSAMENPDGSKYSGDVTKGQRSGMGELFGKDGKMIYEGFWLNDQPHGRGTQYQKDGTYEGEFKAGKRQGKGKFTFTEKPLQNGKPRTYEGSWKADYPEGVGKYLDENGLGATYQFRAGQLDPESIKPYKQGACGSVPKVGPSETKPASSAIKSSDPQHWGKKRNIDTEVMLANHKEEGKGVFEKHHHEDYSYVEPTKALPPGPAPTEDLVAFGAVAGDEGESSFKVLTAKMSHIEGYKLPADKKEVQPYMRMKMDKRAKQTEPVSVTTGGKVQIDKKIKYYHRGANNMKFEMWDNATKEYLCGGAYDITKHVAAEESEFSDQVSMKRGDKEVGTLYFTMTMEDESKCPSKAASSSVTGLPNVAKTLSAISAKQTPTGPHMKVAVHSASALPKPEGVIDADPYVRIVFGKLAHQTRHRLDGGFNPKFDESFAFAYEGQKEILFQVMHLNPSGPDVLLGETKVSNVATDAAFSGPIDLQLKGAAAGKLNVTYTMHMS